MALLKVYFVAVLTWCAAVRAATIDHPGMKEELDVPPQPLFSWPGGPTSKLGEPVPSTSTGVDPNAESSCNGGGDNTIGWSCPHLMMFSPDMQFAAKADNNSWAAYAVAGIGSAQDCGSCYQLEVTDGSVSPSKIIVQAVNTGGDVGSGQFDLLMGGGGFGIYDSCSSDCQTGRVCSGGPCHAPMYSGGFSAWTPDGNCYGGGVRSVDQCDGLTSPNSFADKTLIYGCKTAITKGFHANKAVSWSKVSCPPSLYKLTGIKRKDNLDHPEPSLQMRPNNNGRTTTTMDCCKPTCAWPTNVASVTDSNFPQVYTCNKEGVINFNNN